MLGELELTAFGSVFIGLPGFEEELVVAIKGNGVLGMVDDTDVDDDIFQSAMKIVNGVGFLNNSIFQIVLLGSHHCKEVTKSFSGRHHSKYAGESAWMWIKVR